MAILNGRLTRARGRVAEIEAAIAAMSVKATAGRARWSTSRICAARKKKPGDGMWRGESVLEIASLERMAALGQVDEVDASKIAVGQRVGLRLEAHPDKEYAGTVERVASLVQTESPESRVEDRQPGNQAGRAPIALLMRPAMRFRGRIEIARVPDVLAVPLAAIESTPAGPVVYKLSGGAPKARGSSSGAAVANPSRSPRVSTPATASLVRHRARGQAVRRIRRLPAGGLVSFAAAAGPGCGGGADGAVAGLLARPMPRRRGAGASR